MEYLNAVMTKLSTVPTELQSLDDTQKVIFIGASALLMFFAISCTGLLVSRWRAESIMNHEKEDLELDNVIGSSWHDDLVNLVNNNGMTKKQYRKYCRGIKLACPGWLHVGTYGPALQAKFKTQAVKSNIAHRLNYLMAMSTVGWMKYLTKEEALSQTIPERFKRKTK